MVKKVLFLVFLTFLAVAGGLGIIAYGQSLVRTGLDSLTDINGSYGASVGFSSMSQTQEQSPNGALGITITATLTSPNVDAMDRALKDLASDITKVSDDQLVNINIEILLDSENEYQLNYYPTTPGDYENGNFSVTVDTLKKIYGDELFSHYSLTVAPIKAGRYITVVGGNTGVDQSVDGRQSQMVKTTAETLVLNPGDVFDVTYENNAPEIEDTNFVGYHIETMFTSQYSYEQALNIDFLTIDAYRKNVSGVGLIKFVRGNQPQTDELIVVLEDASEGNVQQVNQKITSGGIPDVRVPASYQLSIRAEVNGANLITVPTYYGY